MVDIEAIWPADEKISLVYSLELEFDITWKQRGRTNVMGGAEREMSHRSCSEESDAFLAPSKHSKSCNLQQTTQSSKPFESPIKTSSMVERRTHAHTQTHIVLPPMETKPPRDHSKQVVR